MVPFGSTASTQIRFLLQSVNDSNFDSVFLELTQFIHYGLESSILLLQSCLDLHHFEGGLEKSIENPNHILLGTIIRYLLSKPNFSTILCESLRRNSSSGDDNNNGPVVKSVYVLGPLVNHLEFTVFERIAFGLALCDSEDVDVRRFGKSFCVSHIEEVLSAHHNGNGSIVDCSSEVIQSIVLFLTRTEGVAKHVDSFMQLVALVETKSNWGSADLAVLSPLRSADNADERRNSDLFYSENDEFDDILEEIEKEMSMADIVKELGYGCTVNVSHCNEVLSLFLPLNEVTIARLLSTIARTHGVLEEDSTHSTFCSALGLTSCDDPSLLSTWNVEVLVESIKQLAPYTDWIRVMENLDHEGLCFPSESSFSFFMSVYRNACQDPFPLHAICGTVWNNVEGQISFLRYAVSASPEVFTFEHSARQLVYVDAVHGHKLTTGNANQAWICLDLFDVLCQLAETGHAGSVRLMLDYPLKHCPEVLLLGLSQINTAYNLLQHEVLSAVFPMVVRNLSRAGVVLHLWNINPNVVLRGLLDVQNFDSEGMIKTFDICQELKILSPVLDMAPFSFSIKLAALASGKGQINLDKWLNDNLSTYGDTLFEGCLKFLKEIHVGVPHDVLQHSGAVVIAYLETVPIFIKVLLGHAGQNVSRHDQLEELKTLHAVFIQNNTKLQNGEPANSSSPDGVYSDDVEGEANSFFHQMFSGQLSTDAMVQMLARFKESPDKREQDIYNFMIGNLFEEYKFFPKYPERQLKIVAVLFGSLIKHQLVTHLLLGVALRAVLDALRKSADSKMFVFGAKALEQFVDRLIEWPQYCNHILQISHLRSTHSELVMFIECALASISSSHAESNGGSVVPTDHQGLNPVPSHQGLNPVPPETMEVPESSWKVMGSGGSGTVQSRQQLPLSPSPFQVQQRNQVSPDDRHKSAGQLQTIVSAHDGTQKASVAPPLATVLTQSAPTVPVPVPNSTSFLRPSRGIPTASIPRQQSSTGFGSALNIETLVAAAERRDSPIEVPASETQDRILFLINNISSSNFETKAKELTEVLNEEFYPWFAQYMVMKRASIEPNYHDQYLKFLDKVNSKVLNKEIVKATYENCKVLLRSELIKSSSEERSLLKNLGSWLGKLTIGRNQVLRAREIDPKALIIEAYEKGLMIAVIPFTSKILEPCQSSLAYQPPNPWTMGILGLLAEIYALPNLKMNLKFDIEVLLKNLGVEMKDVKPTSLLKDRVRELEGNPDFSNKDVTATKPQVIPEVNPPISVEPQPDVVIPPHSGGLLTEDEKMPALTLPERLPSGQGLPVTPSQSPFSVSQLPTPIANIGTDVIVNPKISALGLQLQFQRIVPMAMERAIKEIMSPVVQRSVTIAIQTTKELVLKDYAMESDETRIYNAAHLMVASLAGSLAHVTCKEPLRVSISSHLRNMIQPLNVSNDLEQAVQISTNDNLDLGCAVVEKAAIEKALQTIDGEIAGQLAVRRKRRDAVGPAYFDATTYTQGPMGGVPEALRPKPGRLSLSQQRVYEDFVRFPWQNQPSQSSNALPAVQNSFAGGSGSSSLPRSYGLASGQPNPTLYSSTQGDPGFGSVVQPPALASEDMDPASTQILSASSARIAASDVVTQHGSDVDSVVPLFPSTIASTEPISVDPSDSTKDSGATAQPLPESFGTEHLSTSVGDLLSTEDVLEKYHIVAQNLEDLISKDSKDVEVQGVIDEVPEIILRSVSRDEAAVVVARDVFKSLYGNTSNSTHVGAQIAILVALRDVCKVAVKEQLTVLVIYSEDEYKFNKDIIVGLIRSELLNLAEYGMHMAKLIDAGRNTTATEFAISLLQALVTQESGNGVSELHNLIEALAKLTTRPGSPESLPQLLEIARDVSANTSAPSGYMVSNDEKANQARDRKAPSARPSVSRGDDYNNVESMTADPHGFREQVSMLFKEWYRISEAMGTNDVAVTRFVSQLQQSGLLKGDDMTDCFFRLLTELSVTHCLSTEVFTPGSLSLQSSQQAPALSFVAIDMYAKLVILILKYCAVDQGSNKLFLLPKILLVTVRAIQKDADERKIAFNPRPYFRLFVNWLLDLGSPDSVLEGANFQILTAFANAFHALQPLKVPGFSYAWLELVSHRSFMPKLLYGNSQKTSPYVQRLLVDLFKFMEPYLRNAGKSQLGDPVHFLYKGTLRVLLVLLHDFPEFLCNYHFSFCDVIPPSCIQMRNVILSAFPRNMRLPDPSTPNLKIDLLAEISQSPCIFSDVDAAVKAKQMKGDIDEYLKTRQQGPSFLAELKQRVLLSQGEAALAGTRYNVPLMNSLVLYVGMQAIQQLQTKTPPSPQMAHTAPMDIFLVGSAMDIFQTLIGDLDTEGRYLFLNAVANQLRYPNNHTHYFSFVLLYLFAEANQEAVQEQITRVLLERLIVNRPHPWGLLITFIELIKNPRYNFWTCSFTRCAPEIEKLFESVSRSCGGPKTPDESLVSDGGAH